MIFFGSFSKRCSYLYPDAVIKRDVFSASLYKKTTQLSAAFCRNGSEYQLFYITAKQKSQ